MFRYKITIEYVGTGFVGWQRQDNGSSIQQLIEEAIFWYTKQTIVIFAAGRTDAGVHALGQVAHFDLCQAYDELRMKRSLNYVLKDQNIIILECELVCSEFHARFSALMRHYKYQILNRSSPTVIDQDRVWWISKKLDITAIRDASQFLIGEHDFTSFRASFCQAQSPVKTVHSIKIDILNASRIDIHVSAKSFLHHMVRNIVGTLVEVGRGKYLPSKMEEILHAKNRGKAGMTAPACGLFFMRVDY